MPIEYGLELARSIPAIGSAIILDLTALILVAVFLFLMILMNKLLFQPYLRVKEQRTERIEGKREAATEMRRQAFDAQKEYALKQDEIEKESARIRQAARQAGKDEEQRVLAEARAEVGEKLMQRRQELSDEIDQVQQDLDAHAEAISKLIVEKVLAQ